jgi:hypothetical protein
MRRCLPDFGKVIFCFAGSLEVDEAADDATDDFGVVGGGLIEEGVVG